ncbi:hypothetical protein SS1G_04734 [Sclerotinia sclerotiorum 1980 UF-70]|uniref:Protein MON2 homolog n=1 Tax=Sclerotinia sclerotiorum (strain ATCC 18683 / 1980 / Ss-1) TaxID=665079 RepID=A7EHE2_SCLS1|nr:hypothetical protein SS1G_04734 [Sclerotinia sclerotiorum 1980 UF-70]EDO02258.1 hypothetical protein SS1G_04734 [Sclerotinia sclerotiorum 1980 UF-70]
MTAQILASELGNLIQESKRKHTDLRNAAEKSLDEIRGLRSTSEAQIAADLTQRANFVTPFLIACGTKNVKFTGIAVVCLQRLVVSRALPRSRLREVLEALREATSAGLDVQLKILQALPSLLQNYADELKGELLAAALNICSILQASKNGIVLNTAAATLQQLVVSVFDKVVAEDKVPTIGEAPTGDGVIQLRAAALDAYRVFNDICLLTEAQKPQFLNSTGLPQTFGLELIESVLTNHADIFLSHPEQANILRVRVMPFIINALSEKLNFAVTVRTTRILYTLLRRHLSILSSEGEMALGLLTHMLDHDTALWKRSLCMEILRGIFAEAALIRRIFSMYDAREEKKNILRDLVAAFVRVSTEKPAVIGLGHQSTIPIASQGSTSDQAMLEASGVPGIISSTVSTTEPSAGVNSRPSTPDIRPIERGSSYKRNPIPINPLTLEHHHLFQEVKICAGIVDECWPAILATCSTFLYAALDQEYYHGLVRSFQKFTHVAGLLRLATPRDAFLTTLGKAAVPPNVLTATTTQIQSPTTPTVDSPSSSSIFNNARGLLSVDSLVSNSERNKHAPIDTSSPTLNTRNLLCLRALLNLGIALGPTLDSAWVIVLGTLQQADLVIFSSAKSVRTPTTQRPESQDVNNTSALWANFGTEIKAVETAATRLLESTVDFPNEPFVAVVSALCDLFSKEEILKIPEKPVPSSPSSPETRRPSYAHKKVHSIVTAPTTQNQEDLFALAKLGDIASINIDRLTTHEPHASGWQMLTSELISASSSLTATPSVRLRAADILVRIVIEAATSTLADSEVRRNVIQTMLLQALSRALGPLQTEERQVTVAIHSTDVEVHKAILEGLKSILEQCGDKLISGWDIAFEIIGSVFMKFDSDAKITATRSAKLVRSAFNSLQLTVTFFWVLSDFISSRTSSFSLSPDLIEDSTEEALIGKASGDDRAVSDAALWMLLLLRLTSVTADERLELRNSGSKHYWPSTLSNIDVGAIQTLLRIFDAYGDQLSAVAWSMCLKSVIFRLLSLIEAHLQFITDPELTVSDKDKTGWIETTVVVLSGITNLLADYLDVLTSHPTFESSWKTLLEHFKTMLAFEILDINTAVFKALQQILSRGNVKEATKTNFTRITIDLAWGLWSDSLPSVRIDAFDNRVDNQGYLVAYVSALPEIYRLVEDDLDADRVKRMLTLLREAMQQANASTYSADIEYLTPLQSQVLESLKMIRTDIEGVPATLISQVAEFVALAFVPKDNTSNVQRPTYIALSKASMVLSEKLIISHSSEPDIYTSGAVSSSLAALANPIVLKYSFPIISKSISPWRQATISALAILGAILPIMPTITLNEEAVRSIWTSIVSIAIGITSADCDFANKTVNIKDDQEFDIASFLTLRELITPALGAQVIPDRTRRTYTESLFHMSIIHPVQSSELPQPSQELLATLYQIRKGCTVDPIPSPRAKMSYVCFDELISLVTLNDGSVPRIKLAQAAAPYLILRCGLVLRAYIADQPLRGRMPQPLSQRKELLYILKKLVGLKCESEAIPDTPGVESEGKKHLHRLYPLFVKTMGAAARDQEVLEWIGKALEEVGMEFGL